MFLWPIFDVTYNVIKKIPQDGKECTFKFTEGIYFFLFSVGENSNFSTQFVRQLTSLSAGANQIDYVLVFSNGLH